MSSKKLEAAKKSHAKFLSKHSIRSKKKTRLKGSESFFPDLTVPVLSAKLSNTIPSNGFKRELDDYKWKQNVIESQDAISEAERKKSRVAPYTNKGAYMYVTDEDDKKSLGRKV